MKKLSILMIVALISNTLLILLDIFVLSIPEFVLGTVGIFFLMTLGTFLITWIFKLIKKKQKCGKRSEKS